MTRKECLDKAAGCVLQDRNSSYGGPENSFGVIANFWSVYLGRKVYPADVAMMMALLKIARIKGNHGYADGYIDLAGYAACGAECVQTPAPEQKPDELMVLWKHKPKAEGVEELVVSPFDAPQTKEELYSKILESNPATFKAHTPTGEELAEMAEEAEHG